MSGVTEDFGREAVPEELGGKNLVPAFATPAKNERPSGRKWGTGVEEVAALLLRT